MASDDTVNEDGRGSPRRPGRPRIAHYDAEILRVTQELLLEKGYSGFTIDAVAAKVGVGRPTIYRRWPTKAALAVAAMGQSTGLAPAPDTGSLREDLLAFQRHQVNLTRPETRQMTAGLVADLVADPELADVYVSRFVSPRRASVAEALQRGIDRGELRPDADFEFILNLLIGPLFMQCIVFGEPSPPDMPEKTVDVVLAAFGARPSD
jgi:AcrR family transcriptional regulator